MCVSNEYENRRLSTGQDSRRSQTWYGVCWACHYCRLVISSAHCRISASPLLPTDHTSVMQLQQLVASLVYVKRRSVGPHRFCVCDNLGRTNNILESFHSGLRRSIQVSHPNLFNLLTHLQNVTVDNTACLLLVASTLLFFWATMSKQRSTLSKVRNFNAKLVRHCCRFWQQSRTLLRHCCWCGPGFRIRRPKKNRNLQNDTRIKACIARYDAGAYSNLQHLHAMSHFLGTYSAGFLAEEVSNYDDNDRVTSSD